MVRSATRLAVRTGLIVLLVPGTLAAQDVLLLRFAPRDEAPVVIAFQTHTSTSRSGGTTSEFADLGLVTSIPLGVIEGAHVLHLSYDSVRVRSREAHRQWREFSPMLGDSGWAQVRLDDRLRVVATSGWQHPGLTDPIALVTGVRDLELPDRPLRVGDRWQTRPSVRIPHAPDGSGMTTLAKLVAAAAVTLDSIVVRPHDTLGFLSVQGAIHRTTVVDWSFTGDLAGSLVWSTGWNAFVSGTNRSRVRARKRVTGHRDDGDETLAWETTTRYRVQP